MNGSHWKSVPTVGEISVNSLVTSWPPKKSFLLPVRAGSFSADVAAGNRGTSVPIFSADSGSLLRNSANLAATIGFLDDFRTALAEPPTLPDALAPPVHCGNSAARHLPAVSAAVPFRNTGPQAAEIQEAYFPL